MSLHPSILQAVTDEGYLTPTPIQQQAIPPVLKGKDLLGIAQTGTGKTAAFALPILNRLASDKQGLKSKSARVLVLAPTRELAIQVAQSFEDYGTYLNLSTVCIYGGVSDQPQKKALARGADILVATPGRLLDLLGQGALTLRSLGIFVLDEADRMLDMGFIHDIRKIVALLPPVRQNLFFSATMPDDIAMLAAKILHKPVRVEVTPASTPIEIIDQVVYSTEKRAKLKLLTALLKDADITRALVFTRTKHGANKVCQNLQKIGIDAAAIHGNKSQTRRQEALRGFQEGTLRVLVATDIAARGIDVDMVSHVFNYDLPEVPETYVHRIGRTARAGESGTAISFCAEDELKYLSAIDRLIPKKIPRGDTNAVMKAAGISLETAPVANRSERSRRDKPYGGDRKGPGPEKAWRFQGFGRAGTSRGRKEARK
ncbi:MAG: DEAD/DEAH box helicase [Chitinispirillaceae bacterium]